MRGYRRFYEPLFSFHLGMIVRTFEEVVSILPGLLDRINEYFGTTFEAPRTTSKECAGA